MKNRPTKPELAGIAAMITAVVALLAFVTNLFGIGASPSPDRTTSPTPTQTRMANTSTSTPSPTESPPANKGYRALYPAPQLRVPCDDGVDLDAGVVDLEGNADDIHFDACDSMGVGSFGDGFSDQATADSSASACKQAIQTAPLDRNPYVNIARGDSYCVLTGDGNIALVTIGPRAPRQRIEITVSAWAPPPG